MLSPRLSGLVAVAGLAALVATGCGGSQDDRPAKWSFIAPAIVEPSCATVNCHSAISQRAGLDLSARDVGYASLANGFYVIAGDPDHSSLLGWLNAAGPMRMPPDNPLSAADIDLISRWISDGATND